MLSLLGRLYPGAKDRMTSSRKLVVLVCSGLLLAACSGRMSQNLSVEECDVSWLKGRPLSPEKSCELRVFAKRCAVSDRCYIACEAKGGAPGIGGGCGHLCSGGGGVQTDDDIAANGGLYATPESVACYNNAR